MLLRASRRIASGVFNKCNFLCNSSGKIVSTLARNIDPHSCSLHCVTLRLLAERSSGFRIGLCCFVCSQISRMAMFAFAKKGKIACSRRQPFRGLSAKTQVEVRVVAPQPMRFDHKKTEVKLRLPGFRCNPFFFSVQRRVASARSFNIYPSMFHMRLII